LILYLLYYEVFDQFVPLLVFIQFYKTSTCVEIQFIYVSRLRKLVTSRVTFLDNKHELI